MRSFSWTRHTAGSFNIIGMRFQQELTPRDFNALTPKRWFSWWALPLAIAVRPGKLPTWLTARVLWTSLCRFYPYAFDLSGYLIREL